MTQGLAFDAYGAEPCPGERSHRLVALEHFPRRDALLLVRTQALLLIVAVKVADFVSLQETTTNGNQLSVIK